MAAADPGRWSARSAARCTPTATPAPRAAPRSPTARSPASVLDLPGLRRRLRRAVGGPGPGRPGPSPRPAAAAGRQPGRPGRAAGGGPPSRAAGAPAAGSAGPAPLRQRRRTAGPPGTRRGRRLARTCRAGRPAVPPRRRGAPARPRARPRRRCELCAAPIGARPRPCGGPGAFHPRLRLPRLLPAVHRARRRPRPVPRRARALPARSRPAADRRRVGRTRRPRRARLLPAQLAARAGLRLLPEPGRRHRVHARPGRLGAARPRPPAAVRGARPTSRRCWSAAPTTAWSASWCRSTRATSWRGGCGCVAGLRRRGGGAAEHRRVPRLGALPAPVTWPGALTWPNLSSTAWAPAPNGTRRCPPSPCAADQRDQRPARGSDRAAVPDQDRAAPAPLLGRGSAAAERPVRRPERWADTLKPCSSARWRRWCPGSSARRARTAGHVHLRPGGGLGQVLR